MMLRLPGGVPARLATRESLRHRARSALVVLLVALPVAMVMALSMLASTMSSSGDAQAYLGSASALVEPLSGSKGCHQTSFDSASCPDAAGQSLAPTSFAALDSWPGGSLHLESASLPARIGGGATKVGVTVIDLTSPHAAELFHQPAGNPAAGQVDVGAQWASQHGLQAGDVLQVDGRSYTIGQVLRTASWENAVVVGPSHPLAATVLAAPQRAQRSYLYGPEPTAEQVHQLNDHRLGVTTRSAWLQMQGTTAAKEHATMQAIVLAAGLVVGVLVATIIGAAFAIGVAQQRRSLALLAATGAPSRVLQRVVVGQGVVLGLAGSVLGVLVGTGAGFALHSWYDRGGLDMPTQPHVVWPVVLAALVLGVLASSLAAWLPARQVAHTDVLVAVREAGAAQAPPRRPLVGLVLVLAGVAVTLGGALVAASGQRRLDDTIGIETVVQPTALGLVLAFVGLLLCLGWILVRLGQVWPRGPLAWRMALRDGARNRSRATACVAASLATATLVGALLTVIGSEDATEIAHYQGQLPVGSVLVPLPAANPDVPTTPEQVAQLEQVLATTVAPVRSRAVVREPMQCSDGAAGESWCSNPANLEANGSMPSLALYTPELFHALTGHAPDAAVAKVLEAGGVVVFSADLVHDQTVQASVMPVDNPPEMPPPVSLPAVLVPTAGQNRYALASPAALHRVAPTVPVRDTGQLLLTGVDPTPAQAAAFTRGLNQAQLGALANSAQLEQGPHAYSGNLVRWIGIASLVLALAIAAVAGALSLSDARQAQASLAAIGASTRTLRMMAAVQALVVTGLGGLLGVTLSVGFLSAAFTATRGGVTVGIPWRWLAAVVLGVPLLAAAAAWAFNRPPAARAVRVD